MSKLTLATMAATAALGTHQAYASGDTIHLKEVDWAFDGVFGTFDRQSIQRGFQVYKEVCSSCHGLDHVAYRNLTDVGFSEDEVKAIAAEKTVMDGPNDDGDMFERAALPSDKFVAPFSNEKAARAANNGAYPPDLSLIIKARFDGPNYVYSLLTGYQEPPAGHDVAEGMHYNPYFAGGQIAMGQPLMDDSVTYQDGTSATLDQEARDVVNFLQWAAEPEMEQRKRTGIKAILYLFAFTILFIIAKKRVWKDIKGE
ncbi:MAG: cytochrome c1 [Hyphomicrobiales bacterium]|nr:cytochrome c1 [Hyphomicrobiales bacterium]